jgi:hypothetical protein
VQFGDDDRAVAVRYGSANSQRDGVTHFGGLHAAQYLVESTVQPAQLCLEGCVVFLMGRCVLTGMPDSMRNADLLCEQQEQDASEMREPAFFH